MSRETLAQGADDNVDGTSSATTFSDIDELTSRADRSAQSSDVTVVARFGMASIAGLPACPHVRITSYCKDRTGNCQFFLTVSYPRAVPLPLKFGVELRGKEASHG